MAKFRQINKFLEIVRDVYPEMPSEGELVVCDLCCGKSYLTFAVYYYLTAVLGRKVKIYGVDRKTDVIAFCDDLAKKLNFDGMEFIAGDILQFDMPTKPDMVISLHACDIATDIVLAGACRFGAKIILSTPCCHHEMFSQSKKNTPEELSFLMEHSILRQKFCTAATDALRALRLEAEGYCVDAFELIDPEETPKNVILKCVYKNTHGIRRDQALVKYRAACELLGVSLTLDKLLSTAEREEKSGTILTFR
jgi:SAM-dependent methyltransferase